MASSWAQMMASKMTSSWALMMASSLVSKMSSSWALVTARSSHDDGIKLLSQQIEAWHQRWHQAGP
eukprot:10556212-Ditylum_brightwellii.AAC.1